MLDAASVRAHQIADELGGLDFCKLHATDRWDALTAASTARRRHCYPRERGAVDVTLELWSDPQNDGQRKLLLGTGGRGKRPLFRSG